MRGEPAQGGPDLIRNSAHVYEYVQKRAAYPMLVATPAVSDYILAMDRETLLNRLEATKRRVAGHRDACGSPKERYRQPPLNGKRQQPGRRNLDDPAHQEEYLAEVEEILDELDLIPLVD